MPSRKSMKNGKKKTKSRGRKQNCRTLRCKTGRRVNSKGYFRKKTKRKSRKTKGGGEFIRPLINIEIGTYKGNYYGYINNEERDGNGKLSLIDNHKKEPSLYINGEWKDDKFVSGEIYVESNRNEYYNYNVTMTLRKEEEEEEGLLRYYDIGFGEEQYKQLESDIPPLIKSEFFVNNISEEEVEEV